MSFYRDRLGFDITFQGPGEDDIFFGIVQRGAAMIILKDIGVDPVPNYTRDVKKGMKAMLNRNSITVIVLFLLLTASGWRQVIPTHAKSVRNSAGMQLRVVEQNTQPTLRIVLPGHPSSDRAIEIIFPEHVTVRLHGSTEAGQLYLFRPGQYGERPQWRQSGRSLEYERNFPGAVHMLIWAPIDPRLTSVFHDVRLERTYVHHADGFDLLASETPDRLTMLLDQWLPARYLASFTWPVPSQRVEHRDGIPHYNKSRAVDAPFIATIARDSSWVIASFTRNTGNVWSNPELTCQHVDPQAALSPGEEAILETKLLVVRGSLDDVFKMAMQQRDSLELSKRSGLKKELREK